MDRSTEHLRRIGLTAGATRDAIRARLNDLIREHQAKQHSPIPRVRERSQEELRQLFQIREALLTGPGTEALQSTTASPDASNGLQLSYHQLAEGLGIGHSKKLTTTDVGLLIDTSGSMVGDKLADAKKALLAFIDDLGTTDIQIGLAEFGDTTSVVCEQTREYDEIRRSIERLQAGNGTPLHELLLKVVTAWEDYFSSSFLFIVVTDGQCGGEDEILSLADELKRDGVRFITIGIGRDVNEPFLRSLASSPDDYHFAAASIQLETIYREISDGLAERD